VNALANRIVCQAPPAPQTKPSKPPHKHDHHDHHKSGDKHGNDG
jgi:hypothetical protein